MATTPTTTNWVRDLAFEVALGYFEPEQLQRKYNLTPERFRQVLDLPEFDVAVLEARRSIDEEGTDFKLLARKLATELLPELARIGANDMANDSDRIAAVKEIARLAGYGKEQAADAGGNQGFSVTINVGNGESSAQVVSDQ